MLETMYCRSPPILHAYFTVFSQLKPQLNQYNRTP